MTETAHNEELRELAEWEHPRIDFLDAFMPVPWFADGEAGAIRWRYCRAISLALHELFDP